VLKREKGRRGTTRTKYTAVRTVNKMRSDQGSFPIGTCIWKAALKA